LETDMATNGQLSTITIPYFPPVWFGRTQHATSGTTGTTGTTGDPTCPGRYNQITDTNHANQFWVFNYIGKEYMQNRMSELSQDFFETYFSRLNYITATTTAVTTFKQRVKSVIEFIDTGAPGYVIGVDQVVSTTNLGNLEETFWFPFNGPDANSSYNAFVPIDPNNPVTNIMSVFGAVNYSVSPCAGYPYVPNVGTLDWNQNWTPFWVQTNTKLALWVNYLLYQTKTPGGLTVWTGDQRAMIFNQYHPYGLPTQIQSTIGPINVINSQNSVGTATQPSYDVYYTFDSMQHVPLSNFKLVETMPH